MKVTNYRLTLDEIVAMAEKRMNELIAKGEFLDREFYTAMSPVEQRCYILYLFFTKKQRARLNLYSKMGMSSKMFDINVECAEGAMIMYADKHGIFDQLEPWLI